MGCFLISFCLGNSRLPFAHRLPGHAQQHRQLLLRHIACIAQVQKVVAKTHRVTLLIQHPMVSGGEASGPLVNPSFRKREPLRKT